TKLGLELIQDVDLSMRSRDQLPKLLAGLQYIFVTTAVNNSVLNCWKIRFIVLRIKRVAQG
ncbi:MAG: hypothetical protein ACI920_003980, partial [Saprospiraceae bacterium]